MTCTMGFHPRTSVVGVTPFGVPSHVRDRREGVDLSSFSAGAPTTEYTPERVRERSRIIALAIDARAQHYPDEQRYEYQPLVGEEESNRWSEETRRTLLADYNLLDLGI